VEFWPVTLGSPASRPRDRPDGIGAERQEAEDEELAEQLARIPDVR
jgi:hypothetical protein